ncbi:hypothetical protein KQI61_04280 [Anaerocolumna aminovalerica]|uniref:hypothetical protein n=1 Tax=Anaerocolumna aminovalerica TaxID=1527 RepID=UPI001C0ECC5B|nr:hypothetical protein [Anaerocolumna aminovalerica]MBU5331405.1 hypothetical protein [Anaerocolumna aminovalerica]
MAAETPNFKLKKPDRTDFVNIKEQLSDNMDIIDTEIKEAQEKADLAFQSASNGKDAIKAAITGVDPGVTIPTDATFAQLADAIGQIETGVNTDDATATAEKILAGMTAYVKGVKVTGTMPYKSKDNNHPAEDKLGNTGVIYVKPQKGYYEPMGQSSTPANVGGWISVDEPSLRSENIAKNKSIFGVQGDSNVINTSDGTIDAGKILTGYGGYSKGVKYNGSMPNIGQQIITPSTANQNIAAGYHNGAGYVKGDANLIPANILSGKSIFGVVGSLTLGKKYATGTVRNSTTQRVFIQGNRETTACYVQVSNLNLGFTPRLIMYYWTSYPASLFIYFRDGFIEEGYPVGYVMSKKATTSYSDKSNPHEYLYSDGGSQVYTWFAWE